MSQEDYGVLRITVVTMEIAIVSLLKKSTKKAPIATNKL